MRAGIKLANSRGVTAVHDKDGWLGALRLWRQLEEAGSLSLRVWQSIPHERLGDARAIGMRSGFGSPYLRLGYLKVFMDGTLGSQTAWMLDGSGVQITSGEELAEIVRRGAEAGLPGRRPRDRRPREPRGARRVRADARRCGSRSGLRQRIEHAQLLAPEDVHRFAELGVTCSVQFSHAPSDRDLADEYWAGKTDGAYAFRSLLASGAVLCNGSDAPIEELDPLAGIRAGVRRTIDERPPGTPSRRSRSARRSTRRASRRPGWRATNGAGTPIPGKYADLVVLDRDPWDDLDAQVVATMVGGRWVHNPPPWN